MSGHNSLPAAIISLSANLLIAALKLAAALVTRSTAMMAETIHSGTDALHQILLLIGIKRCQKRADELHPFGFSLESYFWSFIIAIFLFTAGALFSIYQGASKLRHPGPLGHIPYAIGVLLLALAAESVSYRLASQKIKKEKGRRGLFTFLRRSKRSELVVIFLEELASIISLLVALVLLLVTHLTGNPKFDALASILIGILLAAMAIILGMETRSLLIGESADPDLLKQIYDLLRREEYIRRVIHVRSLQLGPEEVLLAVKADFDPRLNTQQIANLIGGMEQEIRLRFPDVKKVFIEPAIYDPAKQTRHA